MITNESIKEEQITEDSKKEFLFPNAKDALETLSDVFNEYATTGEYEDLDAETQDIIDRPMLFFAKYLCKDFQGWSFDLIKGIAILNDLDVKIKDGNWTIKIKRED